MGTESALHENRPDGASLHVAVIMDGSGRWALARGLAREEGHTAGMAAVRRTVEAALDLGIGRLTLFAFSSSNWERPSREVSALLALFTEFLREDTAPWVRSGVRLQMLGRRDRLPVDLGAAIEDAERATRAGRRLELRLAIDYSGREAIAAAVLRSRSLRHTPREAFAQAFDGAELAPDVDLLIRTGGEKRLSDFLLWESAWAEMVFLDTMWPDFGAAELEQGLGEFKRRNRRFGRIVDSAVP